MMKTHLYYTRDISMSEANMQIDYINRLERDLWDATHHLMACVTEEGPESRELKAARDWLDRGLPNE